MQVWMNIANYGSADEIVTPNTADKEVLEQEEENVNNHQGLTLLCPPLLLLPFCCVLIKHFNKSSFILLSIWWKEVACYLNILSRILNMFFAFSITRFLIWRVLQ
jgi:hypothetical protein